MSPAKDQALAGLNVLVTRPAAQAGPLAEALSGLGATVLRGPALAIRAFDEVSLASHDAPPNFIIFISRNAVTCGLDPVRDLITDHGVSVLAVGIGTQQALVDAGVTDVQVPEQEFSSAGLLKLPELSKSNVYGQRVMIVRGRGGRETLRETLLSRGAEVHYFEVYERVIPDTDLKAVIGSVRLDVIVISSSIGMKNLAEMIDRQNMEELYHVPLLVPGRRVADEVMEVGFTEMPIIADNPTEDAVTRALIAWSIGEL